MKIGIITDAHLFHKYAITPESYKKILDDFCSNSNIDIIVDCGDLTDRSFLTAGQIQILYNIFRDVNKPFYYVAGNHDTIENTTVLSFLKLKDNIKIISGNKPQIVDNILFVPYTDNIIKLLEDLKTLIKDDRLELAFSHLNITNNIYSSINIKQVTKVLNKNFAKCWFNGHIHTPEFISDFYGDFINIGSCSSLTFGDEHLPLYLVYDTETNISIENYINNSIIHKNFKIESENDIQNILKYLHKYNNYKNAIKIKLLNNEESIKLKKDIKEVLTEFNNKNVVINTCFDYIKDNKQDRKTRQKINVNKEPLMKQLIDYYEKDTETFLMEDIKKELVNL